VAARDGAAFTGDACSKPAATEGSPPDSGRAIYHAVEQGSAQETEEDAASRHKAPAETHELAGLAVCCHGRCRHCRPCQSVMLQQRRPMLIAGDP